MEQQGARRSVAQSATSVYEQPEHGGAINIVIKEGYVNYASSSTADNCCFYISVSFLMVRLVCLAGASSPLELPDK